MLKLIGSRLLQMMLIMGVISLMLFAIFDSDKFKKQIAVAELGGFAVSALSDQDYQAWLEQEGPQRPVLRPLCQMGRRSPDAATSANPIEKNEPVGELCWRSGSTKTGILALLGLRPDDPAVAHLRRHRRHEGGVGCRIE